MTQFVHIEPGQWALVFFEPYGPCDEDMAEHLEQFVNAGGGWDSHLMKEIFNIHCVDRVAPKTFWSTKPSLLQPDAFFQQRVHRGLVVAAGQSKEAVKALRDKFFAIGVEADERINKEMYRRIHKFEIAERAKALKKIHACLPHIFGRPA